MRIIKDWRGLPEDARGAVVALGNFDGVHLGHAHVLRAAHRARPNAPLGVLTFEPHPRELLRPYERPFRLTLAPARADGLAALGVQIIYEMPFDTQFSEMTAETFVTEVLHHGIGARHLVCGPDFAFGHRRGGDTNFLGARAEALDIGLTVVRPFLDEAGQLSSSNIRRALRDGYPERAALKLGRHWAIRGTVIPGDRRGRAIGFPTANVLLGRHLEPARGVYAVTAGLADGRRLRGVANIGRRPTVHAVPESLLEVNLFDFAGDIYGEELEVALIAFLRPERKFAGIEALRAQIAADAAEARRVLDLATPPSA
jgi:riboflavin kinase/FMN adenylyltransferase